MSGIIQVVAPGENGTFLGFDSARFAALASGYKLPFLNGADLSAVLSACEFNAEVADRAAASELAQIWRMAGLMFGEDPAEAAALAARGTCPP